MPYKDPIKAKAYLKDYVARRRTSIRDLLRGLKEKCGQCGYDRCKAALHFHHYEDNKELKLSEAVRHCWAEEKILAEVAKCKVLCANCHAEAHNRGVQGTIG